MKVEIKIPKISYPYLAVYSFDGEPVNINKIEKSDIYLIDVIATDEGDKFYVQKLLGGGKSYFIENEDNYYRLPLGFTVKITQD